MNVARNLIRSLGHHLGIKDLDFNDRNVCMFRDDQGTTIAMEDRGDHLLIYVSRPVSYLSETTMGKALRATYYRAFPAFSVGACLAKGDLITLFSQLEGSSMTYDRLLDGIQKLSDLLNTIIE